MPLAVKVRVVAHAQLAVLVVLTDALLFKAL
jgi:hypothetical protein